MPEPDEQELTPEQVETSIADEIVRLHEDSYGTGVTNVEVHVHPESIFVMADVQLSRAEQTLLDNERGDAVVANREAFQAAISPTFKAVVERATGRRVAAFISHMHVDPTFALEVYRLAPEA